MRHLFANPRNDLAGGAGGDLDAGRRRVRQPRGAAAPAHVPRDLRDRRRCSSRRRRSAAGCSAAARCGVSVSGDTLQRGQPVSAVPSAAAHRAAACAWITWTMRAPRRSRRCSRSDDMLAVFGFGSDAPRQRRSALPARAACSRMAPAPFEVWRTRRRRCSAGREGDAALRRIDGHAAVRRDRDSTKATAGIEAASRRAPTRTLLRLRARSGYPHLLRSWNYLDAITDGDGDAGALSPVLRGPRARAWASSTTGTLARRHRDRPLRRRAHAAGLLARRARAGHAGRESAPGQRLSLSRASTARSRRASRARCCRPRRAMPLLLSGTASVVGHESRHHDCSNRSSTKPSPISTACIAAARMVRPALPARFGAGLAFEGLRARQRRRCRSSPQALDRASATAVPRVLLHAAICRRELRVEIDGVL